MNSWLFLCCTSMCALGGVSAMMLLPFDDKGPVNICCLPTEWQAQLYLDYGTVFIDQNTAFAYFNGSVTAAFSFPQKKVYFHIIGFELSPLIPHPEPIDWLLLYDFENYQMYNVQGGECQKSSLESNMTEQCIPHDAKHVSTGVLGSGDTARVVNTYRFSTNIDVPYDITATVYKNDLKPVEPKICQPVYAHYFTPSGNPDSGSMYGLHFFDLGPITTKNIFDIPKACQ